MPNLMPCPMPTCGAPIDAVHLVPLAWAPLPIALNASAGGRLSGVSMTAYYNEIDPYAAQWLRNLIKAGHIADGVVDERSIEDVKPSELRGYTQCHFFAGVGIWSFALRRAGWPDDLPVWTGSCPCQPFSSAGAGAGFEDPRHLWPTFAWLIRQCKPPVIFGEQVASKAVEPWVDLVHADMEAMDYAFGAIPFPSAGVGAPHIRDRLFWVGHADHSRPQGHSRHGGAARRSRSGRSATAAGLSVRLANANSQHERPAGDAEGGGEPWRLREAERLANSDGGGRSPRREGLEASGHGNATEPGCGLDQDRLPGPVNGAWAAADWLRCRDARWRPVEPGTFPLADGVAARVGRLRAYGNAINAEAAREFISAFIDSIEAIT
jgi:DNA (cytosine-5)-methyltransferase 1